MRILLDTHVFLWHLTDDPRLPASFLAAILDPTNEVYLSVASVWEAVIKYYAGKLPLPRSPEVFLPTERQAHGIASLATFRGGGLAFRAAGFSCCWLAADALPRLEEALTRPRAQGC